MCHGVLTSLSVEGLYTVIDRVHGGPNLAEHLLDQPLTILPDNGTT